eukprot:jgi/Astpho2/2402/Aster-x0530
MTASRHLGAQLHPECRGGAHTYCCYFLHDGHAEGFAPPAEPTAVANPSDKGRSRRLLRIAEEGAYGSLVSGDVGKSLNEDAATARDRRQTTELVAGTTRWRRRLNYIIDQVSRQPHDKLELPMLIVLQVAVYDITEGRLPDYAISSYVDVIKAILRHEAGGYVNRVLRDLLRLRAAGSVPCPPPPGPGSPTAEVADRLAIAASHPTWMVERWLQRFPAEAVVALLAHNNKRPFHGIRCPPGQDPQFVREQLNSQGIDSQVSPYLPRHFIRVREGLQQVLKTEVVGAQSQVQDEAAGLVVLMLDPQPGERILDACAAPGGKAMFTASLMQHQGFLLALDKSERRLKALQHMAVQQGVTDIVHCQAADLRHFASRQLGHQAAPAAPGTGNGAALGLFDRVLLDAPCSGTGVLAKRADLRWRRQQAEIMELCQLQDELLDAAAKVNPNV